MASKQENTQLKETITPTEETTIPTEEKTTEMNNDNDKIMDERKAFSKAWGKFLTEECLADLDYMSNILEQKKYMINSRTGRVNNQYRYKFNLAGNNDKIVINENGHNYEYSKKNFLRTRHFKNDIFNHYKPLGYFIKITEDRRNKDIFWMIFYLN